MPLLSSQLVRALRLDGRSVAAADIKGRVLVHDLGPDLRKGTILGDQHLERVRRSGEVHVVELEPGDLIETAEQLCREQGPVIELLSFRPLKTFVVATERLKPKARELFRNAVMAKLGWYGAEVLAVREVARTGEAVASAYREAVESGAELVLFAGASAIDPLDPAYAELAHAGGRVLQLGAPMHPGSMLWLGSLHEAAVVGVASCAGFGRNSSLDLLLPFVFAYGRADAGDLLRLGHGGLIEAGAGRRFPPYS